MNESELYHAKKHKYIDKIMINGAYRYFYTHEELNAFMSNHRISKDGRVFEVTLDSNGDSTWRSIGYTSVNDDSLKGKIQNAKNFINGIKKRLLDPPPLPENPTYERHKALAKKAIDKYIADPFRPYSEKKY